MTPTHKPGANTPRKLDEPVINEEADRVLGRIIMFTTAVVGGLLLVESFAMAPINMPSSPVFHYHRLLDVASMGIVLIPFFIGMNLLFAARLKIGRDLVDRRVWDQAVAALDSFDKPTQRFLDTSGEAHYLLVHAYRGIGDQTKSDRARQFVVSHRPGPWAAKLHELEQSLPSASRIARKRQENSARASKQTRRRRF